MPMIAGATGPLVRSTLLFNIDFLCHDFVTCFTAIYINTASLMMQKLKIKRSSSCLKSLMTVFYQSASMLTEFMSELCLTLSL
jgi:hypothetical protein